MTTTRTRARTTLRLVIVIAAGLLVVSAGVATVVSSDPATRGGVGEWVAVPGGQLRVDRVDVEAMDHSGMAMPMPDTPADGTYRFAIGVTVRAGSTTNADFSASLFRVRAGDGASLPPIRWTVAMDSVPANSSASRSLVFEVPEDSDGISLVIAGTDVVIALDDAEHADDGQGHGGDEHR